KCRSTSHVENGFEIFDLALDRIGGRKPTLTMTSPVYVVDREVLRKYLGQRRLLRSIAKHAAHDDKRWPLAGLLVRDDGAIFAYEQSGQGPAQIGRAHV